MISVVFLNDSGALTGFRLTGHAGYAQSGKDIVCAAVSSAAYMAANTVTEVSAVPAEVTEGEGRLEVRVAPGDAAKVRDTLEGFRLHMTELAGQYPRQITISEV